MSKRKKEKHSELVLIAKLGLATAAMSPLSELIKLVEKLLK
ncbi:hypothetical protein ACJQWY_01275 [Weissella kandleri]